MAKKATGTTAYAVGVDLGGTFIKAGVVNAAGRVSRQVSRPTEVEKGREAILANIVGAADDAVRAAGLSWADVRGLGLGSPGIFDYEKGGVVHLCPNLKPLEGHPLTTLTAAALGRSNVSVVLENDANAAAFGELWAGVGATGRGAERPSHAQRRGAKHVAGVRSLVLFTLGTGIGGGIVLNGEVWHGANGFAGELGHQTILPDGPKCGCGNRGCLEMMASAPGLVRRLNAAIEAGKRSSLAKRVRAGEHVTAKDIHAAAVAGDALARALMEETGTFLGIAAANMMNCLDPEMVVFGGGMTAAGNMLLTPIRAEAKRRAIPAVYHGCRIVFAKLGNNAGLIGAAGCALKASGISA